MRASIIIALASVFFLFFYGCSPVGYEDPPPPGDDDGGDDDDAADDDAGDDDAGDDDADASFDLSGVWAQRFCQNEHYDTALGSEDGTRVTLARIDLEHEDYWLYETSEVCAVQVPPMGEVEVTFPQALIDGIPTVESARELDRNEAGAVYENVGDPLIQLIAWHPDGDAATDPVPTDASDPRVFDMDNDGLPGATALIDVSILSGEMYVVARTLITVDGTVVDEDLISGTVDAQSQQNTLGASNSLFEQSAVVTSMAGSTFQKVRIDPGTNCDAIIAQADTIFGGPCPAFP